MRICKDRLSGYALLLGTAMGFAVLPAFAAPPQGPRDNDTVTPIKHVIIIVGENRSFEHLFATYQSPSRDTVMNVLSEGIIEADGLPGPDFARATQFQASDTTTFSLTPTKSGPYATLPLPNTDVAPSAASETNPPPFATIAAAAVDSGVLPRDLRVLTTGTTGLRPDMVDTRIINVASLQSGRFSARRVCLMMPTPPDRYTDFIRCGSRSIAR